MTGNQILGIVLLAVGVILLLLGINATQSVGEQFGEAVTGTYSDRTTWYIILGIVGIIIGGALAFFGRRHHRTV